MTDAYVFQRPALFVEEGRIDLFENVEALDYFAKDGGFAVELGGQVVAECDEELGGSESNVWVACRRRACH